MASRQIKYNGYTYDISYETVNPTCKDVIVILHGWGSNKEIMKNSFQAFFPQQKQIYIDLPGFGNSSIFVPLKSEDYKNIIELFLKSLHVEKKLIIGHSFGGKIATLLAPQNLVLLSSAGIVPKKSLKVRTKIKIFKTFKNFFPKNMYRIFATKDVSGMNQIMYETLKKVVDEDFRPIFAKREGKTLLFWGNTDNATPLESGKLIHSLIKHSELFSYEGDHFFFSQYANDIAQKIISRLL
jgi:pimeloyl-ACP methyl ester carboxylesterase